MPIVRGPVRTHRSWRTLGARLVKDSSYGVVMVARGAVGGKAGSADPILKGLFVSSYSFMFPWFVNTFEI